MTTRMTPERWRAVRALFDDVIELDPEDRTRRLRDVANSDPEMHAAVATLLEADAAAEQRLQRLDFEIVDSGATAPRDINAADPFGLIGRTVSHFRVLERIGSGGMGVLYRARDTLIDRDVALKFPLPLYPLDDSSRQRFLREGRAAGALDHPNLCSVYEVGESADGQLFMAMALYGGETLKAQLERAGALDVGEAVALVSQVARGIAAAHAAGIVHRDLKPANLMLLPDGTVKVLDFGLAKVMEASLTGTRTQLGTVPYMAPEQIRGGAIGSRTDLWALGVILYELVTGQRPFDGEHDISVAHAIVHEEPNLPSALRHDVPTALEDLILRLLRKDPQRRLASADALVTALAAISPDSASRMRPIVGFARRLRFGVTRVPRRTAAVVTLLILVGVVHASRTFSRSTRDEPLSGNAQAQLFYDRGRGYEQRVESPENLIAATSLYEQALALDPSFAYAHARLALIYAKMYMSGSDRSAARLERARGQAEAALRLQSDIAEAHLALGHYWGEARQDDKRALDSYELALRGLANSAELHASLARLYRKQARWDDAIDAYRRALVIDPSMMNVATDLALTYSVLRRYDVAIPLIDSVIALEPDNHWARLSKGYMIIRRDGTPDTMAAALIRIPVDWDPQGVGAFARVTVALARRQPEQALTILNAAPSEWMGQGPLLRSRTLLRAQAYEHMGDTLRARAEYEAIVGVLEDSAVVYPTDTRWHLALGLTYAGLGQPVAAAREARRAMELVPLSQDALQGALMMTGAAEIFARAGNADVALELLDRVLSIPAGPLATVPLLRLDPNWDALRADPRFERMLRRHEPATQPRLNHDDGRRAIPGTRMGDDAPACIMASVTPTAVVRNQDLPLAIAFLDKPARARAYLSVR